MAEKCLKKWGEITRQVIKPPTGAQMFSLWKRPETNRVQNNKDDDNVVTLTYNIKSTWDNVFLISHQVLFLDVVCKKTCSKCCYKNRTEQNKFYFKRVHSTQFSTLTYTHVILGRTKKEQNKRHKPWLFARSSPAFAESVIVYVASLLCVSWFTYMPINITPGLSSQSSFNSMTVKLLSRLNEVNPPMTQLTNDTWTVVYYVLSFF